MSKNNFEILTLNKKNITDFAKARNSLMSKSKSEWILFLDSDEKLLKPLKFNPTNLASFYIERKNYFLGKYVGSDKIIRLINKGSGKWTRMVHERFVPSHLAGVIKDNYIIHNTANNLSDYINKINFYSTLHALANRNEGKKSTLFKIIFYPMGKFIETLLKSKNIVFSIMQAFHSYLSWSKLYFLHS